MFYNRSTLVTLTNGNVVATTHNTNGVFISILDSAGSFINSTISITNTSLSSYKITTTSLSNGNFLVTWGNNGKIFDAQGNIVVNDFQISTTSSLLNNTLDLGNNKFISIWDNSSSNEYLTWRIFNYDGTASSSENSITLTRGILWQNATLLSNGKIAIAWQDDTNGYGTDDIKGCILNADGTISSSAFAISTTNTDKQINVELRALANGNFVAVWTSNDYSASDGVYDNIRARIFDSSGIALTTQDFLISPQNLNLYNNGFDVDTLANGSKFIVTWTDWNTRANNFSIYNSDGSVFLSNKNVITGGYFNNPQILELSNGNFVIAWGNGGVNFQIYNSSGTLINSKSSLSMEYSTDGASIIGDENIQLTKLTNGFMISNNNVKAHLFNNTGDLINTNYDNQTGTFSADLLRSMNNSSETLMGLGGNDFYVFRNVFGNDTIQDTGGNDTIDLTDFIIGNATFTVQEGSATAGDDLLISIGTNGSILIQNYFTENSNSIVGTGCIEIINFQNGILSSADIASILTYNATNGNDIIIAGVGNDILSGLKGDDVIDGGAGTDTISYASAISSVIVNLITGSATGGGGSDTLSNIENIIGSSYDDTLTGNTANNIIDGGSGIDTINYASTTSAVTVNLITGTATGGGGTDTLSNIENIIGSNYDDTLTGNSSNNIIDGGTGNDNIDGGTGTDTISYASTTSAVTVNLSTGSATGGAGNDTLLNIENITGSSYDDTLTGNANDNIIDGGIGNDTIDGGTGTDTISYASTTSAVTVNLITGTTTGGSGTDTLSNIENIIGSSYDDTLFLTNDVNTIDGANGTDTISYVGATAGIIFTGYINYIRATGISVGTDYLYNIENIIGSSYNDTLNLSGAANNNIIDGGAGTDTISYASTTSAVTINLSNYTAIGTSIGTDILINIENIIGSSYNDTLTGNSSNNTIDGGAGTDTISYVTSNFAVIIDLTTGTATGDGNDTFLNIENMIGSNYNDTLIGNTANNTIDGGAGNDNIDGGAGTDTISYASTTSAVTVNLFTGTATGGSGTDIFSNIENIIGSSYNDTLIGNSSNNTIDGSAGTDTISYSTATAAVTVNLFTGTATGDGTDTLSNIENIIGSSYNDTLTGNTANNTIDGGAGNDTLIGATGNDLYIFRDTFGNDIIRDTSGTDSIDLSDFMLASAIFTRQEGSTTTGDNLLIILQTNSILIENYFAENSGNTAGTGLIENISFQDDSSVDLTQIAAMGL